MHPQDMLSVFHGFLIFLLSGSTGAARRGISSSTNGQVVDFDCPEEFGYYPHPTDCTQYYVCVFGGALLESCTGGLMYSHELQTCDWPRNVGCGASGTISTVRVTDPRTRVPPQQRTSNNGQQTVELSRDRQREEVVRQRQQIQPVQEKLVYEDELGPAEEAESDRQQRVYRGQPSTLGQVQRDRDGLRPLANGLQSQNAISGQDKLEIVPYNGQRAVQPRQQDQYSDATSRQDESTNDLTTNLTWDERNSSSCRHLRIKRQTGYRLAGRLEKGLQIPVILIPSHHSKSLTNPSFGTYGQQGSHQAATSYSSQNNENFHIVHDFSDFPPRPFLMIQQPHDGKTRQQLDLIRLTKETIQTEFRPIQNSGSFPYPIQSHRLPLTLPPLDLTLVPSSTVRPVFKEEVPQKPPERFYFPSFSQYPTNTPSQNLFTVESPLEVPFGTSPSHPGPTKFSLFEPNKDFNQPPTKSSPTYLTTPTRSVGLLDGSLKNVSFLNIVPTKQLESAKNITKKPSQPELATAPEVQYFTSSKINKNDPRFYVPTSTPRQKPPSTVSAGGRPRKKPLRLRVTTPSLPNTKGIPEEYYENFKPLSSKLPPTLSTPMVHRQRLRQKPTTTTTTTTTTRAPDKTTATNIRVEPTREQVLTTPEPSVSSRYNSSARTTDYDQLYQLYDDANFYRGAGDYGQQQPSSTARTPISQYRGQSSYQDDRIPVQRGLPAYQEQQEPAPKTRGQITYQEESDSDSNYRGQSYQQNQDLYSQAPVSQDYNDQYSVQVDEQEYQQIASPKPNRSEEAQPNRRRDTVSETYARPLTNNQTLSASDVNYALSPPPHSPVTYLTPPLFDRDSTYSFHLPQNKQLLQPPKNGGVLAKSLNSFENVLSSFFSAVTGRGVAAAPQTILRSEIGRIPHDAPNGTVVKTPVIYQQLPDKEFQTFFVEIEPKRPKPVPQSQFTPDAETPKPVNRFEPLVEITKERIVNPESEELFTHLPRIVASNSLQRVKAENDEAVINKQLINASPSPIKDDSREILPSYVNPSKTLFSDIRNVNRQNNEPSPPPPTDFSSFRKVTPTFPTNRFEPVNVRRPALPEKSDDTGFTVRKPTFSSHYRKTTSSPISDQVDYETFEKTSTQPTIEFNDYRGLSPTDSREDLRTSKESREDINNYYTASSTEPSDETELVNYKSPPTETVRYTTETIPPTTSTTQRSSPYQFIIVSTETPAPFARHPENEHRGKSRTRNRYDVIRQRGESPKNTRKDVSSETEYSPAFNFNNSPELISSGEDIFANEENEKSVEETSTMAPSTIPPKGRSKHIKSQSRSNAGATSSERLKYYSEEDVSIPDASSEQFTSTTEREEPRKRKIVKILRGDVRNQKLGGSKLKRVRKPTTESSAIESDKSWTQENQIFSTIKPIIVEDDLDSSKNLSNLRFTVEEEPGFSISTVEPTSEEKKVVRPAYQPINLSSLSSAEEPIPPSPSIPKSSQRNPDHERTSVKQTRGKSSLKPRLRATTASPDSESSVSRTPLRQRGGAASMGVGTDVSANRGTPATSRGTRPTLKPSTAIVSKASESIDIYRNPPHRPRNLYPTPIPDKGAAKCRRDVCLLPDCSCGGKEIPGGYSAEEIPQLVLLTFDDSVNDLNKGLYADLFERGRVNPNGCPISGTFYVSHEWTDYAQVQNLYANGHEMASHSVSHSFGEQFSQKKWTKEVAGQREILSAYGGVKLEDIRGMRAPFLAIGGNKMFKMLYDANFTYDSSMPIYENRPPSWPYTLDYKVFHDCMIPPCPTKSYPGVWEVPMVMWQDLNGGRCSMGDACSNPPTADGVYKMLIKNFERHFTTNRAPFGLFYHAAWFTHEHHKEGFIAFLDTIVNMPEVWLVTNWQAIQYVRDPQPLSTVKNFPPFQCNVEKQKKCNNPKVCNLWHKSGVRYMRTCQPCPDIYPWTGKTGVKNSRVDNEIIDE